MHFVLVLLAATITAITGTPAWSDSHIQRVVIIERGQYHAVSGGLSPRIGNMGPLHAVHSVQLIAGTNTIPARRNTRFGLRYVVEGSPAGASVELRMVTRFPDGGLEEPGTATRHNTHEYRLPVKLGVPGYRDYNLDEEWEVVPGLWVFEFWQGGRKLKEEVFCLVDPGQAITAKCPQAISILSAPR